MKRIGNKIFMYIFLIGYTVISIYPLFFTIISSFKDTISILYEPFKMPVNINFDSYIRAWNVSNMSIYFKNSFVLATASCVILILLGTSVSYALTKFQFKFKSKMYLYFILGMMIPSQSVILPLAFDIGKIGIHDSFLFVILVITAFQIPLNILVLSSFIGNIPNALEEAAIIDGCSIFKIYTKIILPLSVPAIVTVTILNFLNAWNNLVFPLVFIRDTKLMTISVGLLSFFGERQSDISGLMAAIVISCLPPFIVYIITQEKVEKGLTAGAVKG